MLNREYRKGLDTEARIYVYAKRSNVTDILRVSEKLLGEQESLREECISVAATLYQKLLNKGTEVGICINLYDENREKIFYLPPSRSKTHRTELEQTLAAEWKREVEG